MSNEVQFDVDQIQHPSFKPKGSVLARLVIKYSNGLINDERQANYVLVGFAVIAFTLSLFLFPGSAEVSPTQIPPAL
jgi:hypothetical protein